MTAVDAQGMQVVVAVTVTVVKSRSMTDRTSEQHIGTEVEVVWTSLLADMLVARSVGSVVTVLPLTPTLEVASDWTWVVELAIVCTSVSRIDVIGRRDAVVSGSVIVVLDAAISVVVSAVASKEASVGLMMDEVVTEGSAVVLATMGMAVEVRAVVSAVLKALLTVDKVIMGPVD
jgi:hypothetical protein